jgi:hypothetical protein
MKERIEQLALECYQAPEFDYKKFAELIVEECVAQCWSVSEMEYKGDVVSECSKRMRKHFGVEQ